MPISGKMLILKDTQNSQPFDQLSLTAIRMFLIVSFLRLIVKIMGEPKDCPNGKRFTFPKWVDFKKRNLAGNVIFPGQD
jgi:hypothetical protein